MRWPTATDVTHIRKRADNRSRFFLGVQRGKERTDSPPPLMVGQHYAVVAADTYSNVAHTLTFNAANFLNGSDIRPNMTLAVGTLDDPFAYGSARIREVDAANNRLCLEPNNLDAEGYLATGDYIYVDGVYRLYRKLPFIVNGLVYEDGNPDEGAGCAAGIPGCGIAFDDDYYDRPVALMGSPRVAWTNETIDFYGWRSHGRGGRTIERWTWDFDGGTCLGPGIGYPGSPGHPVHAKWSSAGEYIASLVVQDDSGNNGPDAYGVQFNRHRAVRPVLVYDRPGGDNPPYSDFEITSLRGSYGSGWSASVTVYGTADKSEFPDNALIIIFCEDWYGGTKGGRGGWYGQEGILFVGHIRANSVKVDSEKSSVSFEAQTIEQWMKDIDCWPINFEDTGDGDPEEWHEFEDMTVEDCLWFMAEFRSNLKDVTDCFFASDVNAQKALGYLDITEDSLYSQMSDQIGSCFFGKVSASRHGSIHLFKHKNMMDLEERAWWGPPIYSFQKQDWRDELQIGEERQRDSVAQVDFVGFFYDDNGNPQDCFSLAPEHQTCFGRIEKITGILLTGDTLDGDPDPQDEANTLSGLYRAWQNIRFPHIRVPAVNNRFLEPATLDYFAIELEESDTVRGYDWDRKEFLCTEVSYEIDQEKGIILADVTGEASTWGPDGVAGPYPTDPPSSDPPDEPTEYWDDWNWSGGPGSDPPPWAAGVGESLAYFVLSNGYAIRATNVRAIDPTEVIYENLGQVDGGGDVLYWIALDEFDPENKAMACGVNGLWSTTNLSDDTPTWTLEIATPGGYDCFRMVRSSPVQDDVWMAIAVDSSTEVRVYYTVDDGVSWNSRNIATGDCTEVPKDYSTYLEMSSHDANLAWVSFYRADGLMRVVRTTDMWASATCYALGIGCFQHQSYVYENGPVSHHRYTSNDDDDIVIWGGVDYSDRESQILYCTDDVLDCDDCVNICTGTDTGRRYAICEAGCYKHASNRWWCLAWCDTWIEWWVSNDAINWTRNFFWSRDLDATARRIRHAADWRHDETLFVVVEDGDGTDYGPVWYSIDRGDNFQRQTGNWEALCIAEGWTGGSEVDIFCIAPVWTT